MLKKRLEYLALDCADDLLLGKISYDDCLLSLMTLLKKAFEIKDDQACLFIHKIGNAVLKAFEKEEENLDKYLH